MAERNSIPSLDGLRAVAVAFVVSSHLQLVFDPGRTSAVTRELFTVGHTAIYFTQGEFGVTVFFFLSGYLITTLLRMEYERTGRISLRDFYLRRALRILPPFYLVLAAGALLTYGGAIHGWPITPGGLISQALFFNNYYQAASFPVFGAAAGTWVCWSLAVEEHFYLLFPLAYTVLLRFVPSRLRQAAILLGVCGVVLLWRTVLVYHFGVNVDRTYMATDSRIDSILFGCVLAIAENPFLDRSTVNERTWKRVLLPLALAGIIFTWFVGGTHRNLHETIVYTFQGICLVPLFVCAVRFPGWAIFRPLSWGWVRTVGLVSYVLYLVHETIIIAVQQLLPAPRLIDSVVAISLALAVALLVRQLVEVPSSRLRRRLAHVVLGAPTTQAA
jgi:peptidoglycan/LPS O-acetylase OafA/YrhL